MIIPPEVLRTRASSTVFVKASRREKRDLTGILLLLLLLGIAASDSALASKKLLAGRGDVLSGEGCQENEADSGGLARAWRAVQ